MINNNINGPPIKIFQLSFLENINLLSLNTFIELQRNDFDAFEMEAKEKCGHDSYKAASRRTRIRNRQRDVDVGSALAQAEDTIQSPRDRFRTESFLVKVKVIFIYIADWKATACSCRFFCSACFQLRSTTTGTLLLIRRPRRVTG